MAGIAIVGASGIMLCTLGSLHPWLLALSIMPATLAMGILRPPSTHLMLEQQQSATGTASALITCAMALFGSLAMLLMSCGWRSLILPLGLVHLTARRGQRSPLAVFCPETVYPAPGGEQ